MRKRYLLVWFGFCVLLMLAGILIPVKQRRSQGIGGANQANIRTKTEELTADDVLEFVLKPSTDTAEQIGFFFTPNGHAYEEEQLLIQAFDGRTVIAERAYGLKELSEDRFLFVPLSFERLERIPETITEIGRASCRERV